MDDRELAIAMATWLETHLRKGNHGPELEKISGYSENRLRQKFYNATGETPAGYLRKRRLTEAAKALLRGERISDVVEAFGYSSQDNFTTAFKSWFGLNPGELQIMDGRYRAFLSRMKEPLTIMELSKLKQSNFSSTLLGCVKGASDYLDLDWSTAKLFGYSTFAFLVHIHKELCPSGPYCWKKNAFYLALRDMGIRKVEAFDLKRGAPAETIADVEKKLRAHLDAGKVAMMEFLEYQLVLGYDDKGLILLNPWNDEGGTVISNVTFGSWTECLDREGWVYFTLLDKENLVADERRLLRSCLSSALEMRTTPEAIQGKDYRAGDEAWVWWIDGIDRGLGTSHGHWWNAMVWAESRGKAADFFSEVAVDVGSLGEDAVALCNDLVRINRACSQELSLAGNKSLEAEKQKAAISRCRSLDGESAEKMKELLVLL